VCDKQATDARSAGLFTCGHLGYARRLRKSRRPQVGGQGECEGAWGCRPPGSEVAWWL